MEKEIVKMNHIGFICDGGMGSSAMGASILRRKLRECECTDITVTAHAVDMIPDGIDFFVCLKDFLPILQSRIGERDNVYTVGNLTDKEGFETLAKWLIEVVKEQ